MKNVHARMSGIKGSDIYTAGTYKISDDTLLHPIYAIEYAGASVTLTDVKNANGQAVGQKFVTGNGIAITSDMGLMVFREDVHEFTCDQTVKVWYSN
jgi:hypothetical protein